MCTSTSGTAQGLFSAVDSKLLQCSNPWRMCKSVGVDDTSVNIGTRDSKPESWVVIQQFILMAVPSTFFTMLPKRGLT